MIFENKPIDEITLRSYGIIGNLKGRDLVQKICLSCGLIQVNDSRDVIVDVFFVLVLAGKENIWLSSKDIETKVYDLRKDLGLDLKGIAGSNIRRILKELTDYGFIERISSKYRFIDFLHPSVIFENIILTRYDGIVSRIKGYMSKL